MQAQPSENNNLPPEKLREFFVELRAVRDQFPKLTRYQAAPVALASLVLQEQHPSADLAEIRMSALQFMAGPSCYCTTEDSCAERYALDLPGEF